MSELPVRRRVLATAVLLAAALPLHAAERIYLRNGFALTCDHRQAIGGRVRLFTGPDGGNFLEVNSADIAAIEVVPDALEAAATPAAIKEDDVDGLIARAGARHNLDVDLLAGVLRAESGGNARAVSRAGAQGLMQLMPATAARYGVADSFRAEDNINGGTAYLDALLLKYKDNLALALAAYNAGPAAVDRYRGVPPYRETIAYVTRVIREFNRRKRAETLGDIPARQLPGDAAAKPEAPGPPVVAQSTMSASR